MAKDKATFTTKNGNKVEVADNIIAVAVVEAISNVVGITRLKDGKLDEIARRLARGKGTKSVVITPKKEEDVDIDLYVVVQFRVSIPEISDSVRKRVEENVRTLTGISVDNVVIHVDDIDVVEA